VSNKKATVENKAAKVGITKSGRWWRLAYYDASHQFIGHGLKHRDRAIAEANARMVAQSLGVPYVGEQ